MISQLDLFWVQCPVQKKQGGRAPLCFMQKGRTHKLLSYDKFMSHIQQVEIRKVYSVEEEFSNDIQRTCNQPELACLFVSPSTIPVWGLDLDE